MNQAERKSPQATPADAPADDPEKKGEPPARRSAMKLPPGVGVAGSRGPAPRKPWDRPGGGRPQTDAARRKGKSRKVH